MHQRTYKSNSSNSPSQEKGSQLFRHSSIVQAQQNSYAPPTQEEMENDAFAQNKFEAIGLQIKQTNGTITPIEQKRLGVVQAKMDDVLSKRVERAERFGHHLANIPLHSPDRPVSAPVQPKLPFGLFKVSDTQQSAQKSSDTSSNGRMNLTQRVPTAQNHLGSPIQAKLTIGQPGDKYEHEADRVAQQVVQQLNVPKVGRSQPDPPLQRVEMPEEDELQMKPMVMRSPNRGMDASVDLESAIGRTRGGGQPLDAGLQQSMGQAFGADFSGMSLENESNIKGVQVMQQVKLTQKDYQSTFQQHVPRNLRITGTQIMNRVIQREPIKKGTINVAGEEHNESQPRRLQERKYCEAFFGAEDVYWQEAVFKPIEIQQTRGDEAGLRLKFLYFKFFEKIAPVINSTISGKDFLKAVGTVWKILNTVNVLHKDELYDLDEDEGNELDEMINGELWKTLQILMNGLEEKSKAENVEYRKKITEAMIEVKKQWESKKAIYDERGKEAVSVDRDDHMHGSATAATFQGRQGVWKVGDNHVKGIKKNYPANERAYNLVTRQEFNDGFLKFVSKKN